MRPNYLVLTMYFRSPGKGGKYNWIPSASSIAGVTYILVHLWEHIRGKEFRSIIKATAAHYAYKFVHLPWQQLLYVSLSSVGSQIERLSLEHIRIPDSLLKIWEGIYAEGPAIGGLMTELSRRTRQSAPDDDDDSN